jgi:REP element-mobilizing transposase RayT
MPSRAKRDIRPGKTYHLISRFVDRDWFISGDEERDFYLTLLGNAMSKSDWTCLAYAIMSNHIHLAFIAGEQTLGSWTRRVHSPFAGWMNRRHDRIGSLFVRGPKDIETATDDLNEVIAYIHNNPVRAGVVHSPRASSWTSHRAYLGLEPVPEWLHVDEGLRRSGFRDPDTFDAWVRDPDSARPHIERVQRALNPTIVRAPPRRGHLAPLLVQATADELALPLPQLCSPRRGDTEVLARRVAVHCANLVGLTGVEIASALAISQQAVSRMQLKQTLHDVQRLATRVMQRLSVAANDVIAKAA